MQPKLIACRVLMEEMRPFIPAEVETEIFEISRHTRPKLLKESLQAAIDRADGNYDPIFLGYGLCSNAVVGITARKSTIVMPRMHDCIGILLGSHRAYMDEMEKSPAFFLTHGYINGYVAQKCGPMEEQNEVAKKYGSERAAKIVAEMMKYYKRLVYIRGSDESILDDDRRYSRTMANTFGMEYEEVDGVPTVLKRLVERCWDSDFIVVPPGQEIRLEQFMF